MVSKRVDELVLAHARASLDPYLTRPLLELLLRTILVALAFAALLADVGAAGFGVGNPRRLLLALSSSRSFS